MMRFIRLKTLIPVLLTVGIVATAALAAGGWYYSGVLKDGALVVDHEPSQPDLEVVAIGGGQVTLRMTSEAKADGSWTKDGIWGLEWDEGYAQVGTILEIDDQQAVRELFPMMGTLEIGDAVRLDSFAFPDDPQTALGLSYEDVSFSSPLGDFPAWFIDGSRSIWVIFVHGRGVDAEEALRILPTLVESGFPTLMITYRNGRDALTSPDGFYHYGQTEWEDLQGAVTYAIEQGAEDIVLVGYSMGGAVVTNFLYESPLAGRVRGVILDSPMLNFNATIDLGARNRGIPGLLTAVGKFVAAFRYGVDWGALDYLSRVDELDTPILLFHGDADDIVPIETSDELAMARPDLVEYVRVSGATHVRSWNMRPAAYGSAVQDFLQEVTQ